VTVALRLAILAVALSLLTTGSAAARPDAQKLTLKDAKAALRSVGATSFFTASPPSTSTPDFGPLVMVTGGSMAAEFLGVHVFPNAALIPEFLKEYPLPPNEPVGQVGHYLPGKVACNAVVDSRTLPWLASQTVEGLRLLKKTIARIQTSQDRVVAFLLHRCAA
jgi:hypothetical protein